MHLSSADSSGAARDPSRRPACFACRTPGRSLSCIMAVTGRFFCLRVFPLSYFLLGFLPLFMTRFFSFSFFFLIFFYSIHYPQLRPLPSFPFQLHFLPFFSSRTPPFPFTFPAPTSLSPSLSPFPLPLNSLLLRRQLKTLGLLTRSLCAPVATPARHSRKVTVVVLKLLPWCGVTDYVLALDICSVAV